VNAVSSIVTTVAGAIVSLVSIVYTAVVEAATFVAHLAREAADVGGQLLARAAATLVSIGTLVLAALAAFLAWIVSEIKEALNAVIAPFWSAAVGYAQNLNAAVDPTGPAAVLAATGGSLFGLGFAVAVVAEAVIVIVSSFALPASVVSNLIVGIIIGSAITLALLLLPDISSFDGSSVTAWKAWASGVRSQAGVSAEWTSWVNTAGYWEAGPSDLWASVVLSTSYKSPLAALPAGYAFAIAGLAMAYIASTETGQTGLVTSVSAVVLNGVSMYLAWLADTPTIDNIPGLRLMDNILYAADGLTLAWEGVDLLPDA
jgi:hypothetical protein